MPRLTYAIVTPAHDEASNLGRLGEALAEQSRRPISWVVVDDGSTDETLEIASHLAAQHPWAHVLSIPAAEGVARGGPVVRSFLAGLEQLEPLPDVVVKLDADVSFDRDYFERLVGEFERDPKLGIASGSAFELQDGTWRQLFGTATSVWGASRAYRRDVLAIVLPLEPRTGWDSVDEHKAQLAGWSTRTIVELPFRHHRRVGGREASRSAVWSDQGRVAHFLGYRPSYVLARALFHLPREPAAAAMVAGYLGDSIRGAPQVSDRAVRERVRSQQRLRRLPARVREKTGRAHRPQGGRQEA